MTFKNCNLTEDITLINNVKEMINYQPCKVKNDKFYKFISNPKVAEIAIKNKAIWQGINEKSSLDLDDYRELINGIGFMIRDFYRKRFEKHCNQIIDGYADYKIISENIIPVDIAMVDIAMGACNSSSYWYLQTQKDRIFLVKFKYNKNGILIKYRGKDSDIDVTDSRCIQMGKLKIIISDTNKSIYCLSIVNEFLFVVKNSDNKYNFYRSAA